MFGLKSSSLFSDTKKLEREIDGFVDILSEVGLVFKSIVPTYLNHSANGKFDTCIALRTALVKNNKFYVQAGAGIVADSKPLKEYEETVNKAKALLSSLK